MENIPKEPQEEKQNQFMAQSGPSFEQFTTKHAALGKFLTAFIVFAIALLVAEAVYFFLGTNGENRRLNSSEKAALSVPAQGASEAEKKRYSNVVQSIAWGPNIVIEEDCVLFPVVTEIAQGGVVKISNSDTKDHTLIMDGGIVFEIKAGTTVERLSHVFGLEPGIYSYGCDLFEPGSLNNSIVLITEQDMQF